MGNTLNTTAAGTVIVRATITNGTAIGINYTQDFNITVSAAPPVFVPVTNIIGVSTTATAGTTLTLFGTVTPSNATNQMILWSVNNAGTTGAFITGNTLNTTTPGSVVVTATIINGSAVGINYTQNFNITVNAPVITYTVTFDLNGGSHTGGGSLVQTVAAGGSAAEPSVTRSDYSFNGWDTSFTNVTSNITVTAQWTYTGGDTWQPWQPPVINAQQPSITNQPQGGTVTQGSAITLSVSAGITDTGTLTYQWFRNTTNRNTGGTAIAGATNATFTPPTDTVGTVYYYAVITNTNNNVNGSRTTTRTSNAVAVTVNVAPVIPTPAPEIEITKNGTTVNATLGADEVTFTFTANNITQRRDNTGIFTLEISDRYQIGINLPITALSTDGLEVVTDFGTVNISNSALQSIRRLTGNTLRLVVNKSSFQVMLLDADNKEVAYNDPANPLFISIPVTVVDDTVPNGYVALRRGATGNAVMPYSVYNDGMLTFQTATTGSFYINYNIRNFTDTQNHWALGNITFVAARGLFGGIGNDLFAPDDTMTRAMFAQVLANIERIDLSQYQTSRFTDVPVGAWYASAVEWAASVGIVNGVGDNRFDPEANITREQMAVMLMNYVRYKGYELPVREVAAFNDEAIIASWALDAVKTIQAAGIVSGRGNGMYEPQATATRAEVATIFTNFINAYVNHTVEIDGTQIAATNP
jgi:hypothetical protein